MTDPTTPTVHGAPCWVSLQTGSLTTAREFYGGLFGWEFTPGPEHFGPYMRAVLDGELVAGIGESPQRLAQPVAWTTYLSTADADTAAKAIRAYGGTVAVGPLDAQEEAGRMVIAADPSGASFGVWQPRGHLGVGVTGVPGALAWNELVTREVSVAAFYTAVFGFEADAPVPSGDASGEPGQHVTLRLAGRAVAGLHAVGTALPRDRGARWTTWFAVADTDATVRRAGELGGRVLVEAHDVKRGRVAEIADPQGAAFGVVTTTG